RSGSDADLEAQTARRRKLTHLEPLLVTRAERRLRIDVRRVRVHGEVAADQGDVHAIATEVVEERLWHRPPKPHFAELDVARIEDRGAIARVVAEPMVVVLSADLARDRGAIAQHTGDGDAVLTTGQRAGEDASVDTPRVRGAVELSADAGVDLTRQVEALPAEGVDEATRPLRLDVAEAGGRQ